MKKLLVVIAWLSATWIIGQGSSHLDNELNWYERNWFEAAEQGNIPLLEQILQAKDEDGGIHDVNIQTIGTRQTALHAAAQKGQMAAVQWLIQHGVGVGVTDAEGSSVLHALASADIEDVSETMVANIIRYLIQKTDINPNTVNMNQNTPLFVAVGNNRAQIVDALLASKKIDVNVTSPDGLTARDMAVMMGNTALAQRLEKAGTKINPKIDARVKWFYAISSGDLAGLKQGLKKGQSLDNPIEGWYPLHLAVSEGHHSIAQELIKHGARINQQGSDGNTPLHIAVERADSKMVKFLLNHGAEDSLAIKNNDNETPRSLAVEIEDEAMQDKLLALLRKKSSPEKGKKQKITGVVASPGLTTKR